MSKSAAQLHVRQYQHRLWNSLFNLQHRIFKRKFHSFEYMISTDGVSCSLLFIRKNLEKQKRERSQRVPPKKYFHRIEDFPEEQLDLFKSRNLVGCDPGKGSLVYMMDDKGNKLRNTAAQRRKESKAKRRKQILLLEKERYGIKEKEASLSSFNRKSVDYERFKLYLIEKDKLKRETSEFYQREVWRKMNFLSFCYRRKSLDKFLDRIKETFGSNILIGYGDWSSSSQLRNFMPTMIGGLRRAIHQRYDTVTIHERNTNKKCCECHNDLKNYIGEDGKEVHSLLVCSECVRHQVKQTVFRTRDANAAVNILTITKNWIEHQERQPLF